MLTDYEMLTLKKQHLLLSEWLGLEKSKFQFFICEAK